MKLALTGDVQADQATWRCRPTSFELAAFRGGAARAYNLQADQIREGRAVFIEGDTATLQRLAPAICCLLAPGALLELVLNVSDAGPDGRIVPEATASPQFIDRLEDRKAREARLLLWVTQESLAEKCAEGGSMTVHTVEIRPKSSTASNTRTVSRGVATYIPNWAYFVDSSNVQEAFQDEAVFLSRKVYTLRGVDFAPAREPIYSVQLGDRAGSGNAHGA
eukprot:2950525-Amphidinium_carterae.1